MTTCTTTSRARKFASASRDPGICSPSYSSLDGSHWTYLRLFRFAVKGALRQGFGAQSPVGEACTATFMGIHYSPKASLDFWSGAPAK